MQNYQILKSLQEKLNFLNKIANVQKDVIFAKDKNSKYVYANKAMSEFCGLPIKKIVGSKPKEIFDDKLTKIINQVDKECFAGKEVKTIKNFKINNKNVLVHVVQVPIYNELNQIIGITGIVRDITGEAALEKKLIQKETEYKALFDTANDVIFYLSPIGNVIDVNKRVQKITGYSRKYFIGKNITDLTNVFTPSSLAVILKNFKLRLQGKDVLPYGIEVISKDKSILFFEIVASRVVLKGEVLGDMAILRNITEKKKQAEILSEERNNFKKYLEVVGAIVVGINKKGNIVLINDYGAKKLGYKNPKQLIGKNWFNNFLPPDVKIATKNVFKNVANKKLKKFSDNENEIINKAGERLLIKWHNTFLEEKGEGCVSLSYGEDITRERKTEIALKNSETKLKNFIGAMIDFVFVFDKTGKLTYYHIPKKRRISFKSKKIIGLTYKKIFPKMIVDNLSKAIIDNKKGDYYEFEHKVNKSNLWFSTKVSPMFENDKYVGSVAIMRDITDKKVVEEKIILNEKKYNEITQKTGTIVFDRNLNTGDIFWEGAVPEVLGYTIKYFNDRIDINNFEKLIFTKDKIRYNDVLNKVTHQNKNYRVMYKLKYKNDGYINVREEGTLFCNEKKDHHYLGIIKDVSEEAKIEKIKSDFVSIASHQLRTPLTGIKWFIELLLKDQKHTLTEEQKKYINNISQSNVRLIKLVSDLLDVSHIEAGEKFKIEKKKTSLCYLVREILKEKTILAEKKKIILEKKHAGNINRRILLDEQKIRQVINNLIDNAIKYSKPKKKIIVTFKCLKDKIYFAIQDQGVGIPKHQQKEVFSKFFRGSNIRTMSTEGTGLGLYIAKAIVEAHGGKIGFNSVENKGSKFYFEIPFNNK